MKVWVVFDSDYDGEYLESIWSTEALAREECTKKNAKPYAYGSHHVREWEVDELKDRS